MEEAEVITPEYLKGFNEGYIISQHLPELATKLSASMDNSNRAVGFKEGRQQDLLEQRREKYPEWRKSNLLDKENSKQLNELTKENEKDIDEPEPDI